MRLPLVGSVVAQSCQAIHGPVELHEVPNNLPVKLDRLWEPAFSYQTVERLVGDADERGGLVMVEPPAGLGGGSTGRTAVHFRPTSSSRRQVGTVRPGQQRVIRSPHGSSWQSCVGGNSAQRPNRVL